MTVVSWNMRDVPARERFPYWREAVCRTYLPLEPEELCSGKFDGELRSVSGGSLQVSRVRTRAAAVRRTRNGISSFQDGSFFANLQVKGEAIVEQHGVRALARAGDIVLVNTNEPFEIRFDEVCDLVCVTLPGDQLRRRSRFASSAPPLVISGEGPGRLASGYIRSLECGYLAASDNASDDFELIDDLAAEQIGALLARAMPFNAPSSRAATTRSHTSLRRILDFVRAELRNPALSAKFVCRNLGMSRSHLFTVMMAAGLTFAGYVRSERLRHSLQELRDPHLADLSIGDIALRWGFADHAAFTRTFTKEFGAPPSKRRSF